MTWQPIETVRKGEMFIWAAPKTDGGWRLGLAYWTVSGTWKDAYGAPSEDATHWMPLPAPPSAADIAALRMPKSVPLTPEEEAGWAHRGE